MADYREAFIGIDVAKLKNAIAVAESGREGEIRFWGEVDASDASMRRIIQRIAAKFDRVHFCYEAGPTGYGLHRLIRSLGHECVVVAPSLIPRKPGDRVKDEPPRRTCARPAVEGRRAYGSVGSRRESRGYARPRSRPGCRCRDVAGSSTADQCLYAQAQSHLSTQEGLDDAISALAAGAIVRSSGASDCAAGNGRGGARLERACRTIGEGD